MSDVLPGMLLCLLSLCSVVSCVLSLCSVVLCLVLSPENGAWLRARTRDTPLRSSHALMCPCALTRSQHLERCWCVLGSCLACAWVARLSRLSRLSLLFPLTLNSARVCFSPPRLHLFCALSSTEACGLSSLCACNPLTVS
eukprot:3818777-Rhodomonas_salina.1